MVTDAKFVARVAPAFERRRRRAIVRLVTCERNSIRTHTQRMSFDAQMNKHTRGRVVPLHDVRHGTRIEQRLAAAVARTNTAHIAHLRLQVRWQRVALFSTTTRRQTSPLT